MKCPTCQTTLLIADKKGVEIDYCPDCRGIWLDRGELEKILERSAEHLSNRSNYESDYKKYDYKEQHGDHHKAGYSHKKKKSFLDDIFDF
jgi:Zn-finger nucleic acid-binding protein